MANKENLPPLLATPPVSKISPSNKPSLSRQRDHSACRAADTPLKVKKTRENLKAASAYADVPPPCSHAPYIHHDHRFCTAPEDPAPVSHAQNRSNLSQQAVDGQQALHEQQGPPSQSSLTVQNKIQCQKSVSRRVLSRVKQGIAAGKSKSSLSIRPTGSETSLARRLSGRRKHSADVDRRSVSFELSRESIESTIDEVGGSGNAVQRSFTNSTVSTSKILDDLAAVPVPNFRAEYGGFATEPNLSTIASSSSPSPSSPSPQPTPRPLRKSAAPLAAVGKDAEFSVAVPCVELRVTVDTTSVDVSCKRDVWVAIDAIVRLKTTKVSGLSVQDGIDTDVRDDYDNVLVSSHTGKRQRKYDCGSITNLRLCYKPADGCRIRNIIGQKSYRELTPGQQCTLFLKVGVPRMHTPTDKIEPDQASLFAELESIVGMLEADILHVEARYRHSLFPSDNVVALKHTCKVLRPKTESRWSIIGFYEKEEDLSSVVHARLAKYLADHYAADEALELLHRYFDYDTRYRAGMAAVCSMLQGRINSLRSGCDELQPEVVVTDIDLAMAREHYDTAPSTRLEAALPSSAAMSTHKRLTSSTSLTPSSTMGTSLLSAPPRTTSLTRTSQTSSPPGLPNTTEGEANASSGSDSARLLWRHIRRTSLSARQLDEMSSERLSQMEAGDEGLKELRRRAIANKRSVGAETLRGWRWEEDVRMIGGMGRMGEAPWM